MPVTFQDILLYHNKFTSFQKLVFLVSFIILLFSVFRPWLLLLTLIASIVFGIYFCRYLINSVDPFRSDILVNAHRALVDLQNEHSPKHSSPTNYTNEANNATSEYCEASDAIHEELERYVNLILRDFVQSWYKQLTSDKIILEETGEILFTSLIKFTEKIKTQDNTGITVDIINLYRKHLCEFQVALRTYKSQSKRRKYSTSDLKGKLKRSFSIEESFELKFKYHPALLTEENELNYLRKIVSRLFKNVFSNDTYSCRSANILLGEIVASNVFLPVIHLMSRTEWILEAIVKLTSDEKPVFTRRASELQSESACDISSSKDTQFPPLKKQTLSDNESVSEDLSTSNRTNKVTFQIDDFSNIPTDDSSRNFHDIPDIDSIITDSSPCNKAEVPLYASILKSAKPAITVSKPIDEIEPKKEVLNEGAEPCKVADHHGQKNIAPDFITSKSFEDKEGTCSTKELQSSINEKYLNEHKEKASYLFPEENSCSDRSPTDISDDNVSTCSSEVDQDISLDSEMDFLTTFQDVKIIDTEKAQEPRSTTSYTLYTIQFRAVQKTKSGETLYETGTVNRRFREFVNLQARLDDNPKYKKLLKDVKGPKRWLSLPFGNMDKESVETRRKFLDTFLKALCQKEQISTSPDMKEFLAFQGDSRIAFVRKVTDISVPRIDKMFVRTFTGVFDKIAEVLPSFPQEVLPNITNKRESPVFSKDGDILVTEDSNRLDLQFGILSEQSVTNSLKSTVGLFLLDYSPQEKCSKDSEQQTTKNHVMEGKNEQDVQEIDTFVEPKSDDTMSKIPLANSVLDLGVQALSGRDNWICRERVLSTVKVIIGKASDRWLQTKLETLTTTSRCLYYLQLLRETIWPNGKLLDEGNNFRTMKEKAALEVQTKRCILEFIPGVVQLVVGREDFQGGVDQIIESVQQEKLNRHFIYSLLDLVVLRVLPDDESKTDVIAL